MKTSKIVIDQPQTSHPLSRLPPPNPNCQPLMMSLLLSPPSVLSVVVAISHNNCLVIDFCHHLVSVGFVSFLISFGWIHFRAWFVLPNLSFLLSAPLLHLPSPSPLSDSFRPSLLPIIFQIWLAPLLVSDLILPLWIWKVVAFEVSSSIFWVKISFMEEMGSNQKVPFQFLSTVYPNVRCDGWIAAKFIHSFWRNL